ncbi:class I SAM-dependent methyltransferase [Pseudonocardia nematodicida]
MRLGERIVSDGFQLPAGWTGRLGGLLMASGNAATERHVVDLVPDRGTQDVLVLGPGPGIGVHRLLSRGASVVAVDPSPVMLAATLRRCRRLCERGATLTLRTGTATSHGLGPGTVGTAISVNNVMIWPDRMAGLVSVRTALCPGGELWVSAHEKWLAPGLTADCREAGFDDVEQWRWEPPGRGASTAVQLRARVET